MSRRRTLLTLLCLALAACATVPEVDEPIAPADAGSKPQVIGAHGPLTAQQSKALFAKMGGAAQDTLQRHLAVEEAVAETPLIAGNRTRVLRDGTETFRAMFGVMRRAKHHINLEYFIFEDVESDGEHLGDLLVAKRQEGVAVDIIYDSFGSSTTPNAFIERLQQAGIRVVQFNPLNPLAGHGTGYTPNDRDHRKILVIDGATAIVGGVNLSTTYQSLPGKSSGSAEQPNRPWRDTDLEIDGPAVAQLQRLFLDHWTQQKGPPLDDADFFPTVPAQGKEVVRVIGSTPDHFVPRYYVTLLSAIRNAETKVWLSAAYFVPTRQEMEDLLDAARRGVDVRLLVPDESDSDMAVAVQHSRYDDLLEAGVKIYETHGEELHSKTVVVDGVWSVIGSSNFDHRSVLFNDEVDAVVLGSDTGRELERMFEDDFANATRIDPVAWHHRPVGRRFQEIMARTWQSLL